MMKFFCEKCQNLFENEGEKSEYHSATYGPCFKYIAKCPACGTECDEYRNHSKKKSASNEYATCGSGRCSCCG